jgi:hypothetical protein
LCSFRLHVLRCSLCCPIDSRIMISKKRKSAFKKSLNWVPSKQQF